LFEKQAHILGARRKQHIRVAHARHFEGAGPVGPEIPRGGMLRQQPGKGLQLSHGHFDTGKSRRGLAFRTAHFVHAQVKGATGGGFGGQDRRIAHGV